MGARTRSSTDAVEGEGERYSPAIFHQSAPFAANLDPRNILFVNSTQVNFRGGGLNKRNSTQKDYRGAIMERARGGCRKELMYNHQFATALCIALVMPTPNDLESERCGVCVAAACHTLR